jgi:hypothetical protein
MRRLPSRARRRIALRTASAREGSLIRRVALLTVLLEAGGRAALGGGGACMSDRTMNVTLAGGIMLA